MWFFPFLKMATFSISCRKRHCTINTGGWARGRRRRLRASRKERGGRPMSDLVELVGACGRRPLWSPCVKSKSQNWDPTSWKSRPKSFQVSVLETASVKIQAPKLRSQVLKTMSWKPYPKISQPSKLRSQVPKTMSWKPYPKIFQAPKLRSQVLKTMSWKPYPKIFGTTSMAI
jgi:hypothetical protein